MILLLLSIYILGVILCYGIATWLQCMVDEPYVKHLQPTFEKSWHSKVTLGVSTFSWLGVILCGYTGLHFHGKVRVRYSYQPLWNRWIKANYKSQ